MAEIVGHPIAIGKRENSSAILEVIELSPFASRVEVLFVHEYNSSARKKDWYVRFQAFNKEDVDAFWRFLSAMMLSILYPAMAFKAEAECSVCNRNAYITHSGFVLHTDSTNNYCLGSGRST